MRFWCIGGGGGHPPRGEANGGADAIRRARTRRGRRSASGGPARCRPYAAERSAGGRRSRRVGRRVLAREARLVRGLLLARGARLADGGRLGRGRLVEVLGGEV